MRFTVSVAASCQGQSEISAALESGEDRLDLIAPADPERDGGRLDPDLQDVPPLVGITIDMRVRH
jgi:hypothetical protein